MSRGPGKVQRAIEAVFTANPDNAFLLSELCQRVYRRSAKRIEKKHRVAVTRAAKKIPTLTYMSRETLGHELVFYDPVNVLSYAMARLKSDFLNDYRNNDPRKAMIRARLKMLSKSKRYAGRFPMEPEITEAELRQRLAPGGRENRLITEGGAWWEHTEWARMKARGEIEEAEKRRAEWNKARGYT